MNSCLATKTVWEPTPPVFRGKSDSMLRRPESRLSDKLQDITAGVLAYVFMTLFLPFITALVYLATTGLKPGWKWLFRLFRIWIVVCFAPVFKLRQPLKNGQHALLTSAKRVNP